MKTYRDEACAKINLYLDVMEKKENGFHDIKSIMQSVSLHDDVTLTVHDEIANNVSVFCDSGEVPAGDGNIAAKAAYAFFDACGIGRFNVTIDIRKRIPVSAGLAGGSTDAAAVIRLLNEAFDTSLSEDEMSVIGASVGSDVPFCIGGGTAFVSGRGEKLTHLEKTPDLLLVVVKGGEGISTPAAYRMIDDRFGSCLKDDFGNITDMFSAIDCEDNKKLCRSLYNIFEDVVLPTHSTASSIKNYMLSHGATAALLSGSGPSVFGVFDEMKKADEVSDHFTSLGFASCVCRTVSRR